MPYSSKFLAFKKAAYHFDGLEYNISHFAIHLRHLKHVSILSFCLPGILSFKGQWLLYLPHVLTSKISTFSLHMTLCGPGIVIYLRNMNQQDALFFS